MNCFVLDEKSKIEKEFIIESAKSILSKDNDTKDKVVLNAVLLTWLNNIYDYKDFNEKYTCFKELENLISESGLYKLVVQTKQNPQNTLEIANRCIEIYKKLLSNPRYHELSKKCNYHIPQSFLNVENYAGSNLIKQVNFFNIFCKKLDEFEINMSRVEAKKWY